MKTNFSAVLLSCQIKNFPALFESIVSTQIGCTCLKAFAAPQWHFSKWVDTKPNYYLQIEERPKKQAALFQLELSKNMLGRYE